MAGSGFFRDGSSGIVPGSRSAYPPTRVGSGLDETNYYCGHSASLRLHRHTVTMNRTAGARDHSGYVIAVLVRSVVCLLLEVISKRQYR